MRTSALGLLVIPFLAGALAAVPTPVVEVQGESLPFHSFEDDAGGFYVAWAHNKNILMAQHFGPKGDPLWAAGGLVVTSQLTQVEDWNGLADGRGGLTLFWDEVDGVHAQRYRPDGTPLRDANAVRLSSSTAMQPDVVPDATGGTLVVWRTPIAGQRSVLMAQRLDTEGKPVWPRSGIRVSLRMSNQTNPRVVYDNVSGMIVAWRDEVNFGSEMRVQRIDFQGNRLWTLEGLKVTEAIGQSEFPEIAPLGTGEAVLAWAGAANQTTQIFLQKAGPDAKLQWGSMTTASNSMVSYNRWNPILLGDDTGGTWIAWEDYRNERNYQIQLNHLSGEGKTVWPKGEIVIAPAPGDQGKASITHDGDTGVWVGWIDNRWATVGLYVQEIDRMGMLLQGKSGVQVAKNLSKPSRPRLVSLGTGKAVVIWVDRPKKDTWKLFWSFVEAPPTAQQN